MEQNQITQTEFESLFGGASDTDTTKSAESGFSFSETNSMFNRVAEEKPAVVETTKTPEEIAAEEAKALVDADKNKETNEESLFEGQKNKEAEQQALDLKSYFDQRIKEGRFLPFEDGKLETPEDIDALIEANFTHKLEEIKDDVEKSWYETKSPAWQFIAASAEKFRTPAELIPIITGVQNIDTVSSLDPSEPEQAEKIIRIALTKKNENPEIIEEQIELYKKNDKLASIAKTYQPILINDENKKLAEIQAQQEQREIQEFEMIKAIHENAIKTLETPFLGKHKLKNEEKAAIYELIAEPNEQDGGYKIFSEIDALYEKNDFETLREIALLLNNKKAHRHYLGVTIGAENAETVMRKLKAVSTGSTTADIELPEQPRLQRPQGRSNGSGFGFFSK